ncbi:MAG: ArsR family transcriptional regulator [Ramlibacter sp.]|nr:ArsR family transcriptional regulator [Ramlibacter sp.]
MRHDSGPREDPCTSMEGLPPEALEQVAAYFQALSEPTRLQILNLLRAGERNVGEIAQQTGFTSANISRHLSFLMQRGLLERESRGTAVYYRIADPSVFALCDLVCGNIGRQQERAARGSLAFAAGAPAARARRKSSR